MSHRFPFGATSTARPPRRPIGGSSAAFVLGVYPSALHVRWRLPSWATGQGLGEQVGSLAVAVEPTVFWDGVSPSADVLIEEWAAEHFVPGDEPGQHGAITPGTNGTSGRHVVDEVLEPLGLQPSAVWFTDAVDTFFVKTGSHAKRGQADVLEQVYAPFAAQVGLPPADLPSRPSPPQLVRLAVSEHMDRLREEWRRSGAPLLITLGEEAREVAAQLADHYEGPPAGRLRSDDDAYGRPGSIDLTGRSAEWLALTHPGNTLTTWQPARQQWASWARSRL